MYNQPRLYPTYVFLPESENCQGSFIPFARITYISTESNILYIEREGTEEEVSHEFSSTAEALNFADQLANRCFGTAKP